MYIPGFITFSLYLIGYIRMEEAAWVKADNEDVNLQLTSYRFYDIFSLFSKQNLNFVLVQMKQ